MPTEEVKEDPALAPTFDAALTAPPMSRRKVPPSLAERYEDIRFLGEGGMGTVYRALDPRLGRTVAVKLLKGDDPELWRRFIAEARSQARIQHEHVCRVYEAGQVDGEPYIAMQFIDGEPLSRMKDRLTLEQGVKVMQEISAAVHEAHRLGMIHRDIKPGNVLIEAREDQTLKPYIMDFGLAREVEDKGQTQTGAVLGTPAYMPPEQAIGDVRALDRRSDVYSLGATLYDVIAGRPPFVKDHPWDLLMAVAYEEAPPLGKAKKGVPADLETIVMRCLEREPSRRYESARALADDLQRYLDGEPIQAKRASLGYVLWKKAKKHKLLASLLVSLLVGAFVLAGVWVRARRQAAEQARLAQELGESVKEMELFLRAAYELPTHDVERERDVVRGRLGKIEQRMGAAGKAGEGPGSYALGRGHLALGDPKRAREHLEKALAAGYSSSDLEYALGRALGELFRRAAEETKRITNEDERKKKVSELEKELRDPALSHLRSALAAEIEVPAYAEGLIALYEGKNEEALAKAKDAASKAPWMYEAKKLEGDALYAEGSKYRHDAAFDYDKMKSYFDPAAEAYRIAADMGRSDPDVHRAECELWENVGTATGMKGAPPGEAFDAAKAACDRAVRSSSRGAKARTQRALMLASRMYFIEDDAVTEQTARDAEEAVRAAEEAAHADSTDVSALYAVARALRQQAEVKQALRGDASMRNAIAAYERALAADPRFTWALNELGDAYLMEAIYESARGREARTLLRSAVRYFDEALVVDPKFALPAGRRLNAYRLLLESEIEHGREAEETLRATFDAARYLETIGSGPWLIAFWKARAHRLRGLYEQAFGRDPTKPVGEAIRVIHAFGGASPDDYWFLVELIECRLVLAAYALSAGTDAEAALADARAAIKKASEMRKPTPQDLRQLSALVELATLRAAIRRGDVKEESFDAAFKDFERLTSESHVHPLTYVDKAEVHRLRTEWLLNKGRAASGDVESGLAAVERGLAANPTLAKGHLVKGQLLLAKARASRVRDEREAITLRAREAFQAAFRENPLLERQHGDALKEAGGMLR